MKKLFSALFAVVFALTVSGFALAADNAAMPTKAEKAADAKKMKADKAADAKKAKAEKAADAKKAKAEKAAEAKKAKAKKAAEAKDEMKMDNTTPAAEKPGVPSTQTPPKPKGN